MKKQPHGKFFAVLAILCLALLYGCGQKAAEEAQAAEAEKINAGLKDMPPVPEDQADAMGGIAKPKR
jgi:hypothetical protein